MKTESPAPLVSDEHRIAPMKSLIDPLECEAISKSQMWARYEAERAMREATLDKMRAERDELVGALQRLVSEASRHQLCDILSHPLKSDRHKYGETCPPLERIEVLLSKYKTE